MIEPQCLRDSIDTYILPATVGRGMTYPESEAGAVSVRYTHVTFYWRPALALYCSTSLNSSEYTEDERAYLLYRLIIVMVMKLVITLIPLTG